MRSSVSSRTLLAAALLLCCAGSAWSAELVLTNGIRVKGTIAKEDANGFDVDVGGAQMHFDRAKVYTVSDQGKVRVITPKAVAVPPPPPPAKAEPPATPPPPPAPARNEPPPPVQAQSTAPPPNAAKAVTRTRAEVEALIKKEGTSKPPWWDQSKLNYPNSLDMTWPLKPNGGWNNQRNVGQYIWDIVNPNPDRWLEGLRLVHHLMQTHANDAELLKRDLRTLGSMYHNLMEDYPRAAWFWRNAGASHEALAECYWKMGCKEMAVELLKQLGNDDTRHGTIIKLWADMGELDTALRLAEAKAKDGRPEIAYLAAGEACRKAGQFKRALDFFQRVLTVQQNNTQTRPNDFKQTFERAKASIEAIQVYEMLDLAKVRDGTYSSNSYGYSGQIFVDVTVQRGKITDVKVPRHTERQFYGAIDNTTKQILDKQSVKDIDTFSSATITSEAIVNAAAKALASGMK